MQDTYKNQLLFQNTTNKCMDTKIKHTTLYTIASPKIKYLEIHKTRTGLIGWKLCQTEQQQQKKKTRGLRWWHSGWESACQWRGHGFEPWSGKIPHSEEQLGPCATTTEPVHLELVLRNKRGRDSERPAHRNEEWPPLAATRESPRAETKT